MKINDLFEGYAQDSKLILCEPRVEKHLDCVICQDSLFDRDVATNHKCGHQMHLVCCKK